MFCFFPPFDLLHWLPKYLQEVCLPVLQHPLKQIIFFHVNRLQASRQTRPWHNLIMQLIPGLAESTNPIWSALCKLHAPRSQVHLMWVPICWFRCPFCGPHNCMAFYFKRKDYVGVSHFAFWSILKVMPVANHILPSVGAQVITECTAAFTGCCNNEPPPPPPLLLLLL